ncbi:MAG: hypothetical protein PHO14_07460 [Kiritimatiellae bacterium]|nr:hypothetical protein [Kiritimatiellia bacterium]
MRTCPCLTTSIHIFAYLPHIKRGADTKRPYGTLIDLWIHGHTHHCVDYQIGTCRIVSNQRGYATELVAGFQPNKTITI